ncbi:CLUMA_CG014527, isoform A [Clunio marinus]|uniref:CLUMA_CG014527, isoform A n=1 Tax=Clunio marinus TaxID=568069 RepID=A0A1J1IMQ1_9DIPT|nr:CLUMA_CG014527, isoform A [Clunio marinus]
MPSGANLKLKTESNTREVKRSMKLDCNAAFLQGNNYETLTKLFNNSAMNCFYFTVIQTDISTASNKYK